VSTFTLTPDELARVMRRHAKEAPEAVRRGMRAGARRGAAHMPKKTPTDMGQMRNSWRVSGDRLYNDAPPVGILEAGARPHPVSDAGMLALEAWALRHPSVLAAFSDDGKGRMRTRQQAAQAAAAAIAWKLRTQGQKATYFTLNELPALRRFARQEVARELTKYFQKDPRR